MCCRVRLHWRSFWTVTTGQSNWVPLSFRLLLPCGNIRTRTMSQRNLQVHAASKFLTFIFFFSSFHFSSVRGHSQSSVSIEHHLPSHPLSLCKSPLWSSSKLPTWQVRPQHPATDIYFIVSNLSLLRHPWSPNERLPKYYYQFQTVGSSGILTYTGIRQLFSLQPFAATQLLEQKPQKAMQSQQGN